MNARGGGGTEKYVERRYISEENVALAGIPIMQGGVDCRVDDGPMQAPAWNKARDQLVPATSQSDGSTTPGV